jgi:hypothetical protein
MITLPPSDNDSPRRHEEAVSLPLLPSLDSILTDELLLYVAAFLPVQDLLRFQSVSTHFSNLETDSIWKERCKHRWQPWPRYRLTERRQEKLDSSTETSNTRWKHRYRAIEREATRTRLLLSDLHHSNWNLSFVLSGTRGEGLFDHMKVFFRSNPNVFLVPGGGGSFVYVIIDEPPPTSSNHIRPTL